MTTKFIVQFWFAEKDSIMLPVKASSYKIVSDKIIAAFKDEKWISFPTKDGLRKFECTTIFLEKVKFFQIEKPSRSLLEKYNEDDYILW